MNSILKTASKQVSIPVVVLVGLMTLGVFVTHVIEKYFVTEHVLYNYIKEYTDLGVNLRTVGDYCTTDMLPKISKAEILLQRIDTLAVKSPNGSPYTYFVLEQRNKINPEDIVLGRKPSVNEPTLGSPIDRCKAFLEYNKR